MSFSHMLILAVIALIVIPPDKLPEVARQVARFLNDLKRSTGGVWDDLKREALLKPEDLLKYNPPPVKPPPAAAAQTPAASPAAPQPAAAQPSDGHGPHLEEHELKTASTDDPEKKPHG